MYDDKPTSDYTDWPWAVSEFGEWYLSAANVDKAHFFTSVQFKDFTKEYGEKGKIGGRHYDLTKMTKCMKMESPKAQRISYSY
ncbi:hypothetical protein E2P81_ATG10019 [Venturia nashicola]|nr:hypothetical protein E2P81_ATG10019 [Venturia nashicola]